jgi:hypothetical protein
VRFSKGGDTKKFAYRIAGHDEINDIDVGEKEIIAKNVILPAGAS